MQHRGGSGGEVEAGVGQLREHRCGVEVAGSLLQGVGYDGGLGLSGCEDNGNCLGVVGDGLQADGDHGLDAGDLDTSEVAGGRSLGLVVGVGQAGGGVGVAAADVECDVSVRADASEEESYAAHVPYLLVVGRAPVVDHEDGLLLHLLGRAPGVAVAQAQVYHSVGEHLSEVPAVHEGYLLAVDEDALRGVQAEVLYVVFLNIVVETVVLAGVDRVELVYLYEMQAAQVGLLIEKESALFPGGRAFLGVPLVQDLFNPCDKVFRSLACRKADDSVRMLRRPLQETECGELAELGKILHRDVGDVGRKSVFYVAYVGFFDVCEIIVHTKICFFCHKDTQKTFTGCLKNLQLFRKFCITLQALKR